MELSFVISALKKRSLVIVFFAFLGLLLSFFLAPKDVGYRSEAQLVVIPPTGATTNPFADKDRYVATEIFVIKNYQYAKETADELGIDPGEVAGSISIVPSPETDIVSIIATNENKDLPAQIANTYAESYIASLSSVDLDINQSEIEALNRRLNGDPEAQIDTSITDADKAQEDLESRTLGILAEADEVNADLARTITKDNINGDPRLASRSRILEANIVRAQTERDRLYSESALRVNSRVSQQAVAVVPIGSSFSMLIIAGLVGGALLGLVVALAWARFSTKVLDKISVGELLGAPIVAEFPHYRSIARSTLAAFKALPKKAVPEIYQLCVRAEAKATRNDRLVVAVVGTQRGAGATTLALAMAEQFATSGSSVVLVDGDVRDPIISAAFNASANGGIPSVISNDGALVDRQGVSVFTKTMDPRVSVLGLGANKSSNSLKRDNVAGIIEAACRKASIIVMDGGPALDLASTIHLTRVADAVVLATPINNQKVDGLLDIGRQLGDVRDKLLPVITVPARMSPENDPITSRKRPLKTRNLASRADDSTVFYE